MGMGTLSAVLPSLHFFLAVAQHLSFTKAAADLCVTQGAVSHRIRQLEEELGFPLFHRLPRKLTLTGEGERLFVCLRQPMFDLENEIRRTRHLGLTGTLMVHCPPSFAGAWLVPKLGEFKKLHPGIDVHLRCRNDLTDFETGAVDLALFYGLAEQPSLHVSLLMEESLIPVCSPTYAKTMKLEEKGMAGLASCLLLHDNAPWPNSQYYAEWESWASYVGVQGLDVRGGYSFDRTELAALAAESGLGIALGRRRLVDEGLRMGRLVAPLAGEMPASQAYYIVMRREDAHRPRIVAFVDWLVHCAA